MVSNSVIYATKKPYMSTRHIGFLHVFGYSAMSICTDFIALRAFVWLSVVTPAEQEASTEIFTSGNAAFIIIAFEITQMSVQRPQSSISSIGSP